MALDLLCKLLSMAGGTLPLKDYRNDPEYETLLALGLIEDDLVLSAVVCDECDDHHSAPVYYCDDHDAYGWDCFTYGFIEKDRADLSAFRADPIMVAEHIARSLDVNPQKVRQSNQNVIFVSRFCFAERDVSVYLLAVEHINVTAVAQTIAGEPRHDRKLLLSPLSDDVPGMNIDGATFVRLDKAINIHPRNGITADRQRLASLAGVESKKPAGRNSKIRADLFDLLREREDSGANVSTVKGEMREIRKIWAERGITVLAVT